MHFSRLFSTCTNACIVLAFLAARASAYFVITAPSQDTQWVNGASNRVTWVKGVQDGIDEFDVELSRMSEDGLTFVARNVPSKGFSLNLMLQDVPPGDDYFLIFINSTHGVMYATSDRFTILAASSQPSGTVLGPDPSVATVLVSGSPNPTLSFATTFPATDSGALQRWGSGPHAQGQLIGLLCVTTLSVLGAVWTLIW